MFPEDEDDDISFDPASEQSVDDIDGEGEYEDDEEEDDDPEFAGTCVVTFTSQ